MAMNRDKFRRIIGGITTPDAPETPPAITEKATEASNHTDELPAEGQGRAPARANDSNHPTSASLPRFAKRGRPRGRKEEEPDAKTRKVKVSLFLSETLINDLYDWAHADKIHPGEMFERALKPFHEREAKRRNAGKQ